MHPNLLKTAKEIMTDQVVTVSPTTKADIVARHLLTGHFSGVPVVDKDSHVLGIVTEFDLLRVVKTGQQLSHVTAAEIMTVPALAIEENITLEQILQKLTDYQIIRVPVVSQGRLVGIISRANILSQLVELPSTALASVALCYWCEKVRDDSQSPESKERWCSLQEYLDRHHLELAQVSFTQQDCPQCARMVKSWKGTA